MQDLDFSSFGENAGLFAELYESYRRDPTIVDPSWAEFFDILDANSLRTGDGAAVSNGNGVGVTNGARPQSASSTTLELTDQFRRYGHFEAAINPLKSAVPLRPIPLKPTAAAGEPAQTLRRTYCGTVGFEVMHLTDPREREWLLSRIEGKFPPAPVSRDGAHTVLRKLIEGELFESEMHRKYVGTKRFSLEGGETLIAMLDRLVQSSARTGIERLVLGMAHRGRLNVLSNILGKPLDQIFSEFEDQSYATVVGAGDVKYHLGYERSLEVAPGAHLSLEMAPNPSHLEFVNPVVEGICRAHQDRSYSSEPWKVLPVLLHGDAAFAGQGVVFETINYSGIRGYDTGGTVHIIINNQIGFTSTPDEARCTNYCTDMAKGIEGPVFHVNCEDPEAACWIIDLALEFRREFVRDVFVDLYCFRKYGHNEGDDPSFTQPLMYAEIKEKKPVYHLYGEQLRERGLISSEEIEKYVGDYKARFAEAHERRQPVIHGEACAVYGRLRIAEKGTGVSSEILERIAGTLTNYPEGFTPHPKLAKILEKRSETVRVGDGIEWGTAEALALGALVLEGVRVRLSGQDCGRGTFSQRHLALDDYSKPGEYKPLTTLSTSNWGTFEVFNSPLSEAGVVGFEFGYASVARDALVLWEAQFGDFGNGAQIHIDQFLAGSEAKWGQLSGLTLLLPHGYEGQGPEHSSARLERYLQLCAEGNMLVCYPSTAAQYFHLLRRQGLSGLKRPLIVMTPKSLLRNPSAMSTKQELVTGNFRPVLETSLHGEEQVDHIILMTGKVYHDLFPAVAKLGKPSVRLLRIEQLHPFPQYEFRRALKGLATNRVVWVQEEPENMGAWGYIQPYLRDRLGLEVTYVGRPAGASTATGSPKHHAKEQQLLIEQVMKIIAPS